MHPTMSPVIGDQRRGDIRRAADRHAPAHAASGRPRRLEAPGRRAGGFHPVGLLLSGLHSLAVHAHLGRPAALRP